MVTKNLRYFRLVFLVWKYWLIRSLEFRAEVLSWSGISILWVMMVFLMVNFLFGQARSVAGWNRDEVLLLVAVQSLFVSALWLFAIPSMINTAQVIADGVFDFRLTKPIGSRFQSTFCKFNFDNYAQVILMTWLVFIFLGNLHITIGVMAFLGFLILFLLGVFIFYCLFFMFMTLSFWFIKLYNLEDLYDSLLGTGRFPAYIYKGGLQIFFFYIIPAGFIATFPVQFLLGKGNYELIFLGIVFAVTFFLISQWFWNFALKHYSSASS